MKVVKLKMLGLAICYAALFAATAIADDDTTNGDDVARRTERALFKMSQVDLGARKVRVLTPALPVSQSEPSADAQPREIPKEPPAAPLPVAESEGEYDPTQLGNLSTTDHSFCDQGSCADSCCDCDCGCDCLCGPPGNFWVRTEILGWWTKGMHVPPLVTTGTSQNQPGVIGAPGTQVLFGDGDILERARVGGRLIGGIWLDDCHKWAAEADYFMLQDLGTNYLATGNEYPYLSRPIIDVTNGLPGDPGVQGVANDDLCGQVSVLAKTGFQGGGVGLRRNLCCSTSCCDPGGRNPCNWSDWSAQCCRLDLVGGYRYYRLDDSLLVRENLMSIAQQGQVAFGTRYDINDRFITRNQFQGGDIGLIGTVNRGRWSLELLGKVALGSNSSRVAISGSTTTTVPGQAPNTLPGGLLALPSNIGEYSRNQFVAIPQFSAQIGYQWTCHLRTFVGYNYMYWANVARAGDQVDLRVDTNQLPPGSAGVYPQFSYNDSGFWAQGINGGVEVRW